MLLALATVDLKKGEEITSKLDGERLYVDRSKKINTFDRGAAR